MYKRRKTSGDQLQAKPTIISLADVALCLLVIVLSTGGAVRQLMEVSLPEAENSASRDINLAVNLTVTRDGKYYFEDDRTAIRDEERVGPKQLDDKGLLFAASWDDNALNGRADRACGNPLAYFYPGHRAAYSNEGAKGWCMNSQLVCEILDSYRNIDYYEGTVCFYVRKDPLVRNENTFVPDPKETVRFPCGRSNNGETLFTAGLVQNAGSSNSGITLRRFRSWQGKDGYLQLAYQMMGGRLVACQAAPFPWSEEWRHVAILWSVKQKRLEIYLDGKLAAKAHPGQQEWYPSPWDRGVGNGNGWNMNLITSDHGAWCGTCRDEVCIYNRALRPEEILANKSEIRNPKSETNPK